MPSELSRETARIYSEMYEEGIEPLRWPHRFPKLRSRSDWLGVVALVLLWVTFVVVPVVLAIAWVT